MVITEEKKFEACKMVVMGVDRELVHELRIGMMTVESAGRNLTDSRSAKMSILYRPQRQVRVR